MVMLTELDGILKSLHAEVPDPFVTWDDCKGHIPDRMLQVMAQFEKPTCIQAQVRSARRVLITESGRRPSETAN